ncbi:MarR family winged helix-turn-helix transcriptional regulator [Streptomyces telluris]|uniref:MarR family transcriptional regulator n=1 Tax=Streptomyces telluris TaxID=2720021 RepID=A0A9X2LDQ2_9ACTN|nr:MarR family transcriptional regulator [Streptomyces telluris]MCQ8769266.1 MarR family transcriptional regulator [Streptomyces telluris]NJP76568.1 MarR family transcriptional regulator [Streptomyces telluris]
MTDAVDLVIEQWRKERPELADGLRSVEVLGRMQRMQLVYDQHYKRISDEFGVNVGEFDVLSTLRRSGAPYTLSAGAFAKAAMVSPGAITNRLDRLEDKGLVERIRDRADRRSVRIRLTGRGKALIDEAMVAHLRDYDEILSVLTPEECEQIASGLRKIFEARGDTTLT